MDEGIGSWIGYLSYKKGSNSLKNQGWDFQKQHPSIFFQECSIKNHSKNENIPTK
jgi:hypothetical protein